MITTITAKHLITYISIFVQYTYLYIIRLFYFYLLVFQVPEGEDLYFL